MELGRGTPGKMLTFRLVSHLQAPPEQVWAHISSMRGVNYELFPFVRMTCPVKDAVLDPAVIPIGERAFRSWLLLFCVLPVEYDDLVFSRLEPGFRFLETSSMFTLRVWRHHRLLQNPPEGHGCLLLDHLALEPRKPLVPFVRLFRVIARALFLWRHRRLRRKFGGRLVRWDVD